MNANRLFGKCNCGGWAQPVSLGITDEKTLIVTSFCIACEKLINVTFPISELYKSCPKPTLPGKPAKTPLQIPHVEEELTVADVVWLKEMSVTPNDPRTVSDIIKDVDKQFPSLGGVK